jgi:hypothetical protein
MKCALCEKEATSLVASKPQYVPACDEHKLQVSMQTAENYVNAAAGAGATLGTAKTRND